MPNPIKYSTSSETLALNKGNFYIGTGDVGKGPSDTTGYYNGVSPSSGGYVIYMNKTGAPGNLSYHNAPTDAELISFTNNLAGQSYTGVNQCLVYYAGQTDKVCVNRDYESIITNGLVLNLDAGFTPSYPTSGTTWYDISTGGNNGTLTNGPTFNSDNGGSIVFDGVDDYVSVADNSILTNTSSLSINVWVNSTDMQTRFNDIIGKGTSDSNEEYTIIMGTSYLYFDVGDGAGPYIQPTTSTLNNTWYNICCVHSRSGGTSNLIGYINGVALSANVQQPNNNPNDNSYPISIGKRFYNSNPYNRNFSGKIPIVQIYNRALSASEVLQNYNAQKGRFGL